MRRVFYLAQATVVALLLAGCGKAADQKPDPEAIKMACASHLQMIDDLKQRWAQANGKGSNDIPTWDDLESMMTRGAGVIKCPGGGTYTIGPVGEPAQCSIPEHNAYFKEHFAAPPQ